MSSSLLTKSIALQIRDFNVNEFSKVYSLVCSVRPMNPGYLNVAAVSRPTLANAIKLQLKVTFKCHGFWVYFSVALVVHLLVFLYMVETGMIFMFP